MSGKTTLNALTKPTPGIPAPELVATEDPYIDHEKTGLEHDALHCHYCSVSRKILQAVVTMVAEQRRLLAKFQEAEGTPHGDVFSFTQTSPAQNTVYTSTATILMGVVRSLMIGGKGNVTLKLQDPRNQFKGGTTICTLPCNGTALSIPHRFIVPMGATFTLSTDDASGTGIVTLSAWLEPVEMSGEEFYRFRR